MSHVTWQGFLDPFTILNDGPPPPADGGAPPVDFGTAEEASGVIKQVRHVH
eukprot:COSAG06_NODE_30666_length_534_cov_1.749425_1_plen_51_part_00